MDSQPYPDREPGESLEEYKVRLEKEYYTRCTDRKTFDTVDILRFDRNTFTYYPVNFFSEELTRHIISRLDNEDLEVFRKFALENWRCA